MIRLPISHDSTADIIPIFREGLRQSRVAPGEKVVIYADSFTNPVYAPAFMAAARDLGAQAFAMTQPLINADASNSIGRANPQPLMIEVMKQADFVVDVSTGGMLYSNDHEAILATGTRILRVREPEDILLRLMPSKDVKDRAERGVAWATRTSARCMSRRRTAQNSSCRRAAGRPPTSTAWRIARAAGTTGARASSARLLRRRPWRASWSCRRAIFFSPSNAMSRNP
ncbi:MAG: hypothetical protein R3E51_17185 [Rhizobiaceae bacterium]